MTRGRRVAHGRRPVRSEVTIARAAPADAAALAALHEAAANDLVRRHGSGPWRLFAREPAIARSIGRSIVLVARAAGAVVGTATLATRKPWAIDPAFFAPARRPLYLISMAVHPAHQRRGIGRAVVNACLAEAAAYPADAVWLDAWDAGAGAGGFYAKCGFAARGGKTYRSAPLVYYEWRFDAQS